MAMDGTEHTITRRWTWYPCMSINEARAISFRTALYRHPTMKMYPTIAEALTLGTGKLAVDGVVVVGEHGEYPMSPKGIMMHPH